eukprot:11890-Heterococcus_DN1.PRE.3
MQQHIRSLESVLILQACGADAYCLLLKMFGPVLLKEYFQHCNNDTAAIDATIQCARDAQVTATAAATAAAAVHQYISNQAR